MWINSSHMKEKENDYLSLNDNCFRMLKQLLENVF